MQRVHPSAAAAPDPSEANPPWILHGLWTAMLHEASGMHKGSHQIPARLAGRGSERLPLAGAAPSTDSECQRLKHFLPSPGTATAPGKTFPGCLCRCTAFSASTATQQATTEGMSSPWEREDSWHTMGTHLTLCPPYSPESLTPCLAAVFLQLNPTGLFSPLPPPCLPQSSSLGTSLSKAHNMAAAVPGCSQPWGERSKGARKARNPTRTQTRTGVLRLGPHHHYLPWRAANVPRLHPSALVQSAGLWQRVSSQTT